MIKYTVGVEQPNRHFIAFNAEFPTQGRNEISLQLPSWRPGRYELGNFAKNIRGWKVMGEDGRSLFFRKTSKDTWVVTTEGAAFVRLSYQYYACDLNAGSTFLDEEQLYINPVNCFFYDCDAPNNPYEISLLVPGNYHVGTGMKKKTEHLLMASSFDELADCPLIASATLRHLKYAVEDARFHIWIQGEVNLNESRLLQDFADFSRSQIQLFGDLPCSEYHFLFQFVPYFLRHGVEHCNSTVITMGPSADFQQEHLYKDLLGISCHELFHTWNVKNIRPVEMLPYDFTRENYSEQGFVYEGVTTYYGDSLLWRINALNEEEWLEVIQDHVQDYVNNHGRSNLSVAQSSWDTWLDGYVAGVPWRKVSIYNEGFLVALMCDLSLIQQTDAKHSLDSVMRTMYARFGKTQQGYSAADYLQLLNEISHVDYTDFLADYVYGIQDYLPRLREVLSYAGVELQEVPSGKWSEANLGLSLDESNQKVVVSAVVPNSPSDKSGLWYSDEIVAVNGVAPYKNVQQLLKMYATDLMLTVVRKGKRVSLQPSCDSVVWVYKYRCVRETSTTIATEEIWHRWKEGVH